MPDELLKVAGERAEELGKGLDELCVEAIERYVVATKNSSPGAVRSRFIIPRSSPQIAIEMPEELYKRADTAAKSQNKRRQVMYTDALADYLMATAAPGESALDRGHDLPSGAWRPIGPS